MFGMSTFIHRFMAILRIEHPHIIQCACMYYGYSIYPQMYQGCLSERPRQIDSLP